MVNIDGKDPCPIFERRVCNYVNCSDRFIITSRTFERQYAPFYNVRLAAYTNSLKEKSAEKWGSAVPVKRLCDINVGEHAIVIGTLCKHMELRPSILKEISEEHHLIPQAVVDEYSSDNDYLILEDDLQRITLKGNIDPHCHVTGIIVAVLGNEEDDGKFVVKDICYPSVFQPISRVIFDQDMFVMIVSGLGLGSADVLFPLQLLIDYVSGMLGNETDQEKASRIVRVIIAGNSLGQSSKDKDFSNKAKYLTRKTKASTVEGIKSLDDFLLQLVMSVDVDIMPGEFDPANHLMPQQPLHPCMFPKASRYSSFHSVSNPYEAQIGGVRFLGTSGQNIKDIMSYSRLNDPTDVMERTLNWGHLSPTAPDTLNCYPYFDKDPFIISDCPHIYFSGNMPKLGSKKCGSSETPVTVISVPKFCETYTAVLINLRSLMVEKFTFTDFEM